jgi:hypothetical protein
MADFPHCAVLPDLDLRFSKRPNCFVTSAVTMGAKGRDQAQEWLRFRFSWWPTARRIDLSRAADAKA